MSHIVGLTARGDGSRTVVTSLGRNPLARDLRQRQQRHCRWGAGRCLSASSATPPPRHRPGRVPLSKVTAVGLIASTTGGHRDSLEPASRRNQRQKGKRIGLKGKLRLWTSSRG